MVSIMNAQSMLNLPQRGRVLPSRSERIQAQEERRTVVNYIPTPAPIPVPVASSPVAWKTVPAKPLEVYVAVVPMGEKSSFAAFSEDVQVLNSSGVFPDEDVRQSGLSLVCETLKRMLTQQLQNKSAIVRCYGKCFVESIPSEIVTKPFSPPKNRRLFNDLERIKRNFRDVTVVRGHYEPNSTVEKACLIAAAAFYGAKSAAGRILPSMFNDRIREVHIPGVLSTNRTVGAKYDGIEASLPTPVDPIVVFTDASLSKENGKSKCGYGIFVGEDHPLNACGILPSITNINDAETKCAEIALTRILEWSEYRDQPVVLKIDNKEVLLTAAGLTKWSPLKQRLFDMLPFFKNGVTFEHIKSHAGNIGNECADYLSRKALLGAQEALNVYQVVNKRTGNSSEDAIIPVSRLAEEDTPSSSEEEWQTVTKKTPAQKKTPTQRSNPAASSRRRSARRALTHRYAQLLCVSTHTTYL